MKAPKSGWYWIRYRYRNNVNQPEDGVLSEWTPAEFRDEEGYAWWLLFGDDSGVEEELIEEVGSELIYQVRHAVSDDQFAGYHMFNIDYAREVACKKEDSELLSSLLLSAVEHIVFLHVEIERMGAILKRER